MSQSDKLICKLYDTFEMTIFFFLYCVFESIYHLFMGLRLEKNNDTMAFYCYCLAIVSSQAH